MSSLQSLQPAPLFSVGARTRGTHTNRRSLRVSVIPNSSSIQPGESSANKYNHSNNTKQYTKYIAACVLLVAITLLLLYSPYTPITSIQLHHTQQFNVLRNDMNQQKSINKRMFRTRTLINDNTVQDKPKRAEIDNQPSELQSISQPLIQHESVQQAQQQLQLQQVVSQPLIQIEQPAEPTQFQSEQLSIYVTPSVTTMQPAVNTTAKQVVSDSKPVQDAVEQAIPAPNNIVITECNDIINSSFDVIDASGPIVNHRLIAPDSDDDIDPLHIESDSTDQLQHMDWPVLNSIKQAQQLIELQSNNLQRTYYWSPDHIMNDKQLHNHFIDDILFIIPTTAKHHKLVNTTLNTIYKNIINNVMVYTDSTSTTEFSSSINVTVLNNTNTQYKLQSSNHHTSWRIPAILQHLYHNYLNRYKFYIVITDTSFVLLDQILWRISEYHRITYNGAAIQYPLFIGGKLLNKQYDSSLLLYSDQTDIGNRIYQHKKLIYMSQSLFGFNTEFIDSVQFYTDTVQCPILATDELAISGIVTCAQLQSDILLNYFTSTRYSHREKHVTQYTAVDEWRGVDIFNAYKNDKMIVEAYNWYYNKVDELYNNTIISIKQ